MKKDELIKRNIELENELDALKKLLPGSKTDVIIKNSRKNKKSFDFSYTRPSLDWYETIKVTIAPDDYYYFRLEKRFGPYWWLIGTNNYDTPDYHWKTTTIGELNPDNLKRFIDWVKDLDEAGCPLTEINMISGSFDIFKEIKELVELAGTPKELEL